MRATSADRVTYVGHATALVELDGTRFLTDPVLRSRIGPLRRHGGRPLPGSFADLDAVLISHLHRDHADLPSLRAVGRDVPIVAPPGAGRLLARRGFGAVTELAPGESLRLGAALVAAVEARHAGARRGAPGAEAVGYLIEARRRVYFAGDTDLFEGMEAVGSGLDLALLPIWGWGPKLGPGHLDPERAAQAAALLSPRLVVPIHWGTLYPAGLARLRPGPLRGPPHRFAAWMRKLAPQVELRVLEPGQAVEL